MWSVVHFPARLEQHLQPGEVAAVPRRERLEQLQPLGVRASRRSCTESGSLDGAAKPDSPGSKPRDGSSSALGACELHLRAVLATRPARARSRRRAGR